MNKKARVETVQVQPAAALHAVPQRMRVEELKELLSTLGISFVASARREDLVSLVVVALAKAKQRHNEQLGTSGALTNNGSSGSASTSSASSTTSATSAAGFGRISSTITVEISQLLQLGEVACLARGCKQLAAMLSLSVKKSSTPSLALRLRHAINLATGSERNNLLPEKLTPAGYGCVPNAVSLHLQTTLCCCRRLLYALQCPRHLQLPKTWVVSKQLITMLSVAGRMLRTLDLHCNHLFPPAKPGDRESTLDLLEPLFHHCKRLASLHLLVVQPTSSISALRKESGWKLETLPELVNIQT